MPNRWESAELNKLEHDLSGAPWRIQSRSRQRLAGPVGRTLAQEMRVDATGHQGNWFGRPGTSYPTDLERHVSHEMVGMFEVEAGIEDKGSGRLGHIIAYGSVKNAPAYDPGAGPRRAMPRIIKILGDTAEQSILGDESS